MKDAQQIVDLRAVQTALVRFHFTNPRAIPDGIVSINRPSERELVVRRMERAGTTQVSDTRGKQVATQIERVQIALIRAGLTNNGLRLMDAHVSVQARQGKTTKHLLTLGHRRIQDGEIHPRIPEEVKASLRALSMDSVYLGHVWFNPNGTMIVELMMRQPGGKPQCAFVTRDGWLSLVKTEAMIAEEEEGRQLGNELLQEIKGLRI